jgi:hypothetical protein
VTTFRKMAVPALLALAAEGCHARPRTERIDMSSAPPGPARFPVGKYTTCAQGEHNPDGNIFLNTAGFESAAVLTLTQDGTNVTATYIDQNGLSQALSFAIATPTSATLAEPGRVSAGFSSLCVQGLRKEMASPAALNATAGMMTYDAGMVFITLTGSLSSSAADCGSLRQPDATFWLVCEEREGGSLPVGAEQPTPVSQLPLGDYSCSSQVESYAEFNGIENVAARGALGTLELAHDGTKLNASYAGDPNIDGTLRLRPTTSTTARAETGQVLLMPCTIPLPGAASLPPQRLSVAAGSLSLVGSKLFVSFAGTLESSCADARVAGTLICSKNPLP